MKQERETTALVRRQTPAQRRVEELTNEHERLLRAIADKQRRLADAGRLQSEVHTRVALEIEPLERRVAALTLEIRQAFERVLAEPRGLSRRNQASVRECYSAFLEAATFEQMTEEEPPARASPPNPRPDVAFTAPKPDTERARTQHAVFRRLVNAVHPDKVQSRAEIAARTALLKQVTAAYEADDLARLLQFERELLVPAQAEDAPDRLPDSIVELTARNVELRHQLKSVGRTLRAALQALPTDVEGSGRERRTSMNERLGVTVRWWRHRAERLEATSRALRDVEAGNVRALEALQSSVRLEAPFAEPEHDSRNPSHLEAARFQVDASNVDAVLKSFKDVLGRRRKR